MKKRLRENRLGTVCESARCPNIGECFSRKTATIMILGENCNRTCRFCGVEAGKLLPPDRDEPENCAKMIREFGLTHAVVTSVTRDDLPDGGAAHYVQTVRAIRRGDPVVTIELLVPDFGGNEEAIRLVLEERPDILNHNIETVPSLYAEIRPQASFGRSLSLLKEAVRFNIPAKSGIMVGLGENEKELVETIGILAEIGVSILTIGQYLPPSAAHAPVVEYYEEGRFGDLARIAESAGIEKVFSGPFVRSSYMAEMVAKGEI
jgi:lipoic acid synthetase